MKCPPLLAGLPLVAALLISTITGAAADKCLFIGHSFFVPVVRDLPVLTDLAGLNHSQAQVFRSGETGTPSFLWNNRLDRLEIQNHLNAGDVEMLAMVFDSSNGSSGELIGYERWIDYALAQNPDTKFMISLPWQDFPERSNTATYTSDFRGAAQTLWLDVITGLRANYPGVTIIDNPYGLGTIELRLLFDAGEVPDVVSMTNPDREVSIFYDQKGHGGDILRDLLSLFFLNRLYGVENGRPPFEWSTDLKAVAQSVLDAYDAGNFCGTTACSHQ